MEEQKGGNMEEQTSGKFSQISYFRRDRFYYLSSLLDEESGWYFYTRGGTTHGPYPTRELAEDQVDKLLNAYLMANDSGGR